MPVLGRRVAAMTLESGESLAIVTEAAQYSLPVFSVGQENSKELLFWQGNIYPLGSRISYSLISKEGLQSVPVPVLCQHLDASKGARPIKVFPLHNAVDLSVGFNPTTKEVHCLWWWNAWTPDFVSESISPPSSPISPPVPPTPSVPLSTVSLPNPPATYYAAHSVPDPDTPTWLRSLVPKTNPAAFDPTKPFWVAPIPEGYQFDYFPPESVVMGESRAGSAAKSAPARMPDTPGARWLQDMMYRGLTDYPTRTPTIPPPANFGADPSPERDDWERRGGIYAAGEHILQASARDDPEFIPKPVKNPYTQEVEPLFLPGVGLKLAPSTTWEDHLIIVNALKAHFDYANLVNSTRVLMYAKGLVIDQAVFQTIPQQIIFVNQRSDLSFRGPFWPAVPEATIVSALVLEFPRVVTTFPTQTNYRTLINPGKVWYPLNDYPDIGTVLIDDGFLVDGATPHLFQEPAVDWVVSDPVDPANQLLDRYRYHLDSISF